MSIVGYIVGLGDRHGENILIDSTNGDSVHVDFSCLFNRVSFPSVSLCTSSPHSTQLLAKCCFCVGSYIGLSRNCSI